MDWLPCSSLSPGDCSSSCPLSQWSHPTISSSVTLLLLLPSIFPALVSQTDESALGIRWPKYWSFSFSISPSNEYSGLIFFRIDWLDLLSVQGTLKSCLQQQVWRPNGKIQYHVQTFGNWELTSGCCTSDVMLAGPPAGHRSLSCGCVEFMFYSSRKKNPWHLQFHWSLLLLLLLSHFSHVRLCATP